jgi:MerR family redox-sensitive transcriptional activator SoxR
MPSRPQTPSRHPWERVLPIGEVARRSGVAASALRFYEAKGLIFAERSGAGQRQYPRAVLRRVAFIVFAQRLGLTLDDIRAALARLPRDAVPTRGDWARLTGAWTARIDARIAELHRLRDGLTACIGCGCLSLDRCRLANPLDRASRHGPGPRFWIGDPPAARGSR